MGDITGINPKPLAVAGDGGVVKTRSATGPNLRGRVTEYGRGMPPDLQRRGVSFHEICHEMRIKDHERSLLMEILMDLGWRLRRGEYGQPPVVLIPAWHVVSYTDFTWAERETYMDDLEGQVAAARCTL